jgi:hypothetical protein
MFIKLTNATKEYQGEQLIINIDHILSIFELQEKRLDNDNEEYEVSVSNLYTITQQSYIVEEPVNVIYKLIEEKQNG